MAGLPYHASRARWGILHGVNRRTVATVAVVHLLGVAVWAGDRIFTNPKPEAHLKRLFPGAASFSPLEGTPLHFTAYGSPAASTPAPRLGIAFWTTDVVPGERGYGGPIHLLVGIDLNGALTGVALDYSTEPYAYFSIEPPAFARQFAGKNLRDPFRVGADIDAVSRATITLSSAVRAIRDSSRAAARALLTPPGPAVQTGR
jgi:transcriptional regulator of nitric oxide reductase